MPGHIGGEGFSAEYPEFRCIAKFDVTEVEGLDDLHMPKEAIKNSLDLLAQAYGAKQSYFLVNGATSGIHSLFMYLGPDAKVIIPRNVHRSVYGGLILSGVHPIYVPSKVNTELGLVLNTDEANIIRTLKQYPEVKAVFLTNPTYYGTTSKIDTIVDTLDKQQMLFIDEAHGGHFAFHPAYPDTALQCGAHAAINGLHKTLPVLTQGACLHINHNFVLADRLFNALSMLTTTSPSYPIMASIDLARSFMQEHGYASLEYARELSIKYRGKMRLIKGITCYGEELKSICGVQGIDPLKILIIIDELTIDGIQLSRILRQNYDIQVEMEGEHFVLAMMSLFHHEEHWNILYKALASIAAQYRSRKKNKKEVASPPEQIMYLTPRQAYFANKKTVSLEESVGMIAGEYIAVYPPGIPCLVPGELINKEMIDYLKYIRTSSLHIQGPYDGSLKTIKIIDQD